MGKAPLFYFPGNILFIRNVMVFECLVHPLRIGFEGTVLQVHRPRVYNKDFCVTGSVGAGRALWLLLPKGYKAS